MPPARHAERRSPSRMRLCGSLAVASWTVSGCLFLPATSRPLESVRPAIAKPAPKTLALEAMFVRFSEDEPAAEDALWNAVDEQAIEASIRVRLATHGLRVGIASSIFPEEMRRKLDAARASLGESREPTPASEQSVTRRVLRLLPGRESRLVARTAVPELVVFEQVDEDTGVGRVVGRTFRDATSELVLSTKPGADGRTRIELTPAIEHGPQRRIWKGDEGVFRLDAGQARHLYDWLRVDVELPPESMLVVGGRKETESSVASALFRSPETTDRRVVILRPLARSHDPLFDEPRQDGEDVTAESRDTSR